MIPACRKSETGNSRGWPRLHVPKSSIRVDAYGEVDELNASLGSARTVVTHPEIRSILRAIQRDLFSLGARLADPGGEPVSGKVTLETEDVRKLEERIDRLETELPKLDHFILPGGSLAGALLHQARSICRRTERKIVVLAGTESVPAAVIPYLNRLSDLLFVMARVENRHQKVEDEIW